MNTHDDVSRARETVAVETDTVAETDTVVETDVIVENETAATDHQGEDSIEEAAIDQTPETTEPDAIAHDTPEPETSAQAASENAASENETSAPETSDRTPDEAGPVEAVAVEAPSPAALATASPAPLPPPPPPPPPGLDPAAFFALLHDKTVPPPPPLIAVPGKNPRRRLRALARWTTALVVMGAIGAGTALAVALPRRTDLPGLTTKTDGRYTFGYLSKPALAPGDLGPGEDKNTPAAHYADLRRLLLDAPVGASPDTAFPGSKGWYSAADFVKRFTDQSSLRNAFNDSGLRHIAARGWTMPDGVHTTITLLQFPDETAAGVVEATLGSAQPADLAKPAGDSADTQVDLYSVSGDDKSAGYWVTMTLYTRVEKPGGGDFGTFKSGRYVSFQMGDVLAAVETTGPSTTGKVPTQQIVALQNEMLR